MARAVHSDVAELSALYPDIRFESLDDIIGGPSHRNDHFSSPSSHGTDPDGDTHISMDSTSTAGTTPPRPDPRAGGDANSPTLESFLADIHRADLPDSCKADLIGLAKEMNTLGLALLTSTGYRSLGPNNANNMFTRCGLMSSHLREASVRLREQVDNIAWIKTLAPFTVQPAEKDLWVNYRQKTRLITEHTALPCKTERKALEDLAALFNARVYEPFLQLLAVEDVDDETQDWLDEIYDAVLTLLDNYRLWWHGMKDIRQNHMLPVMRKIQKSPALLQKIKESRANKEAVAEGIRERIRSYTRGQRPADAGAE